MSISKTVQGWGDELRYKMEGFDHIDGLSGKEEEMAVKILQDEREAGGTMTSIVEDDEDMIPHRASDNAAYDKIDGLDQDKD